MSINIQVAVDKTQVVLREAAQVFNTLPSDQLELVVSAVSQALDVVVAANPDLDREGCEAVLVVHTLTCIANGEIVL